jgi:uncharacterized OsmC-like protein
MVSQEIVNDLDVDALRKTITEARRSPEILEYKLRAKHRWIEGAHCRSSIQDFSLGGQEDTSRAEPFVLEGDEPPVLLGTNKGPNATEAALHALAACLSTTFIYHASLQGVEVSKLELDLEGDIDLRGFVGAAKGVPKGFQAIRVNFHVEADAPREKIEQLFELAQKHSPVRDTISRPVPVTAQLAEASARTVAV